jgi:4-hydroxybenzoate polyprenyltransferase
MSYFALMRLHKPRGIVLLAWPTLMPFFLYPQLGCLKILVIFICGIVLMRSAGCVVNDCWDIEIDQRVERTRLRPLAANHISLIQAVMLLLFLAGAGLVLWLELGFYARMVGLCATFMTIIYPLMKRYIYLPQLFLGLTFSMGIWMAFLELGLVIDWRMLYVYLFWSYWIFVYDTLYARADYGDDLKIGIYSSAIYIGKSIGYMVNIFYVFLWLAMMVMAWIYQLGLIYLCACFVCGYLLYLNKRSISIDKPSSWTKAFLNHQWIGGIYTISILLDRIM